LTIDLPTFNERECVEELVSRLSTTLGATRWEVLFVDDHSPDQTADAVRRLGQADARVRVVERIGRRGLSSACIEGMLSSSSPYIAVMDADLQHDERLIPAMLEELRSTPADVVVGSRYVPGGSTAGWSRDRERLSKGATWLAHRALRIDISDPMSGFFMLRRALIDRLAGRLSGVGYKILIDILASSQGPLRVTELPYEFRPRLAGASKLDTLVAWEYFLLLLDKRWGHCVPARFVAFSLVGGAGLVVHLSVLASLLRIGISFGAGQTIATVSAMTANFFVNNTLTYRDRRLRGWWPLLRGWATFSAGCSIGALANVGVAIYLFDTASAGWISSALAGILVGAVWNYAVASAYTWSGRP
jgi:dolichol-phosphate mannosyltransferase